MSTPRTSIASSLASISALVTALIALPCVALAQSTSPERLGFSSERLGRVAEFMQQQIDQKKFAGDVVLIARDDRIVYFEAQGLMDIASGRPMQKDAVFRIMSMTKPIVGTAVLMMMEEGRLRLTDPVARFVPELAHLNVALAGSGSDATVSAAREITIRDLLTHTSGLISGGASSATLIRIAPGQTVGQVLPQLANAPLDFQPGTRWSYSPQFGFDTLVRVVEVASGMPFDRFARERIFEPLGMTDTFFYRDRPHPNLATLYASTDNGLEPRAEQDFVNGAYFSGGGGLFSTAGDYFQFASMLLHRGELRGRRLLSPRTVDLMTSAFVPDTLPGRTAGEGYGLAVRVVTDRAARNTLLSDGTFGWSGAFNTHFFVDPTERLIAIYMTQSQFLETRAQMREDFEWAVMQAFVDDVAR